MPWDLAPQYDITMEGWKRVRDEAIAKNESSAMWAALELLIPSDVAELHLTPVNDALVVHDQLALESLTGSLQTIPGSSTRARLAFHPSLPSIAEMACQTNPAPILELIWAEEAKAREESKRGGTDKDWDTRIPIETSPRYEYDCYLRWRNRCMSFSASGAGTVP
ncbi:hypothetical protein QK292_11300 [Arthrobacter sp. AL08]|uniref:hypothetical protein n=1 Tax=Micrococcaceae TaxID=1268 RepID=UPI00249B9485|nr:MULTISPECIES: hypothetical protein [Micrococcaceae]MDI3242239.1 hypothetical protein [Arthrobacter sp. AL05]MDI3278155.1 hypothetical protein [Arthrobacter sp. AL08]MDJ0353167.1 hypothetical protein [Pseudarthrobacter sp. PH31-O2]